MASVNKVILVGNLGADGDFGPGNPRRERPSGGGKPQPSNFDDLGDDIQF